MSQFVFVVLMILGWWLARKCRKREDIGSLNLRDFLGISSNLLGKSYFNVVASRPCENTLPQL